MARIVVWIAVLTGLVSFMIVSVEPAFAQDPGGGGRPGGGRRPGGGERGRERFERMMEEMQKEVDKAAADAVRRALDQGKSEEEAKEAGKKAADEAIDKAIDKMAEDMGRRRGGGNDPGGGNNPGGGAPPGGGRGFDPEQMKERMKERAKGEIDRRIGETLDRAIEEYKATSWKEIVPKDELADEAKLDEEIKKLIKDTTLFDDFKDTADKYIKDLKLTKPVILLVYMVAGDSRHSQRKAEKCEEMRANVLGDKDFISASNEYIRLKLNIEKLNSPLKAKYGISSAPRVVFFDCTGKKLYSFTNTKQKVKTLLKKMEGFVKKSDEVKEKTEEKKEGEEKEAEEEDEEKDEKEEEEEESGNGEDVGGES